MQLCQTAEVGRDWKTWIQIKKNWDIASPGDEETSKHGSDE